MHPARLQAASGACPDCGMALEPLVAAVWTCPMHPEVVARMPGSCPHCGMALESIDPAPDEDDRELREMHRRLILATALGLPVMVLAMGGLIPGAAATFESIGSAGLWIQFVLAAAVVLVAGWPLLVRARDSFRARRANMFTLIGLGTVAAFLYSAVALLSGPWLPASFLDGHGRPHVYFEAAVGIVALVLLGQVLELRARRKTREALTGLARLVPEEAHRVDGDRETTVPLAEIVVGDRLRVRSGERVPVDGSILTGGSAIDESLLTGESIPVAKQSGDAVTAGTLNGTGSFVMQAGAVGRATMLARVVALVAAAQRSRAPVQKTADRVSAWFVPAVIVVSIVAFFAWLFWGPDPALAHAVLAAVTVLIVACPCALGLATPVSITIALGRGAQSGLLVRDAESLERFARVDIVVLDKTGTLTEGRPELVSVAALDGDEDGLLAATAALERGSDHPLAAAIVEAAEARELGVRTVEGFRSHPGKGVTGRLDGREWVLGNRRLFDEQGIDLTSLETAAAEHEGRGETVAFVAVDGKAAGFCAVADPLREHATATLEALRRNGLEVAMLTGDSKRVAAAVARQLGIERFEAGVLPEGKHDFIRDLQARGKSVAMVGDGVNDAAALAVADVGVAMGGGADVALDAASITLPGGDLRALVRAHRLARATLRNIRQNLWFAFVYNGLGVPVAAGLLYPLWGIRLHPMFAAAAMSLSSVSVILNALRLRRAK
ncbi:MAG: copper-translocating P-type ATPase [Acidobacteria bacterium]|nr:MAG: copper-translocating P-type ATPase [Acidobacteriota bacterium]